MLDAARVSKLAASHYMSFKDTVFNNPNTYVKRSYIDIWQKELDDEFQKATKSQENFDITVPAGTLFIDFADTGQGKRMCMNIATGVMVYWSKAIGLGAPAYLDKVESVVNDAITHIMPLYNDILSIRTSTEISDYYMEIHTKIIKHVRNIQWTVIEKRFSDNSTTAYIEKVT